MSDPNLSDNSVVPDSWLRLAMTRTVLVRGLICAAIVGSLLCTINHCDCIMKGMFGWGCFAKSSLTAIVPFLVSVVSSVNALRNEQLRQLHRHE